MAKGVFTTKVNPTYDDLPEVRYHFPRTYLNQAKATVGDWIVYYEPRRQDSDLAERSGRQVYFATARVQRIAADPRLADHYYAFVTAFLEFENIVSFRQGEKYLENALMKEDGSTNKGAFGRAVRLISEDEYQLILQLGFAKPAARQPEYAEEHEILMARKLVPDPIKRLLNPDGKILLPADSRLHPHPQFLRYHREHIFKG